jgi:hypothetical protein
MALISQRAVPMPAFSRSPVSAALPTNTATPSSPRPLTITAKGSSNLSVI